MRPRDSLQRWESMSFMSSPGVGASSRLLLPALQQQLAAVGVDLIIEIGTVANWLCALGAGDCGPDWKYPNMFSQKRCQFPARAKLAYRPSFYLSRHKLGREILQSRDG